MDQAVCLDTDVCIEIIRDTPNGRRVIDLVENKEIFISSISVFELYLRNFNLDKIDFFLEKVSILSFDTLAAKKSSEIDKKLKKKGKILEIRDIFIAASCLSKDLELATFNIKHFEKIDELILLKL